MRAKAIAIIMVCLTGFLSVVLATSGDVPVADIGLPTHGIVHGHRPVFGHSQAYVSTLKREMRQGTNFPNPPTGPVFRCHDPHPEVFGSAPPVEDCKDVIKQFTSLTTIIDVKLVEGCYQIVSGNCTGMVCPQRNGESTVLGAVAAQYMASPLLDQCIAKGQRGWWMDGQGMGIGVYLT